LIRLNQWQGRLDEAYRLAEELHRKHPQDQRPLYRLLSAALALQETDKVRSYAEKLRALDPDDPYNVVVYYQYLANADVWDGRFMESMAKRYRDLEESMKTNDSTQIFQAYNTIGDYYRRFGFIDSMEVYERIGHGWAPGFSKISYPMRIAAYFPEREAEMRPQFEALMNEYRAKLPREFWGIADGLETLFDGSVVKDTSLMIAGIRKVIETSGEQADNNIFQLGRLLIATGEYDEGKELLSRFLSGNFRTNSGWRFLISTYWVGRANEGLGLTADAVDSYEEFLDHWSDADIQLEQIVDAKERLARLTS
jgi:tetratricopeptide (TPR) repeat protein